MAAARTFQSLLWMLAAVIGSSVAAQPPAAQTPAAQTPAPSPVTPVRRPAGWRQQTIHFSNSKALVGMPEPAGYRQRSCSAEGTSYFDLTSDDTAKPPELYSVNSDGIVRHLRRTLPQLYTSISITDFFPTEHELVSLVRTSKSDLSYNNAREEVTYWISLTEHNSAGDGKLLQLDLKFRPIKIALFATGEFVVLGWDEANLLPMLVVLKEDGTPRRFLDVETRKPAATVDLQDAYSGNGTPRITATLAALGNAKFVPYDGRVLLTYPGTARGIQVLTPAGVAYTIPIALPSGFLLHDVLVSGSRYSLVLRAQSAEDFAEQVKNHQDVENPKQRVFEMHASNGAFLREFLFATPHPKTLTCAANNKLTAIFDEPIADPDTAPAYSSAAKPAEASTHRVIAAVPW